MKKKLIALLLLAGLSLPTTAHAWSISDLIAKVKRYSDETTISEAKDDVVNGVKDTWNSFVESPEGEDFSSLNQGAFEITDRTANFLGDAFTKYRNKSRRASEYGVILKRYVIDSQVSFIDFGESTIEWDWSSSEEEHILYGNLDKLGRVNGAVAYLSPRNLMTSSKNRTRQTWKPTGWHNQKKNINGKRVHPQARGHLIAYSLTKGISDQTGQYFKGNTDGSEDNPRNLFTQTQYTNNGIMKEYENKVRDALKEGHLVMYEVTPIFMGEELMARGVHMQAITDSGNTLFNVYFANEYPGLEIDYMTGRSSVLQ